MDFLKSVFIWLLAITFILVCFPITCLIWLAAFPFDGKRKAIHWALVYQSYFFAKLMPVWHLTIEGREKAAPKEIYVIISNHQSILDIIFINCLRYRYKWISKIEIMKKPLLGWYLRMAGYITVNRGDKDSKEEMLTISYDCLQKGTSIMLFPEGTRSVDGEIGFFKRGAFQLAISTKKPILPILLDGSGKSLPKHGFILHGRQKINIRVFDPVPVESFNTDDPDTLALKFSTFMTEALKEMRAGK
jgi:1-acyl-sn-glycerol-3-phosphate acyltransferase